MKVPKFVRGVGINLALEALNTVISKLYHKVANEKDDLIKKVMENPIKYEKLEIDGKIGEIAKNSDLENRLSKYNNNFFD